MWIRFCFFMQCISKCSPNSFVSFAPNFFFQISNMEGSVSWVAFIFTISIALSSASGRQLYCCEFSFIALDLSSRRCEIDVTPWLPCDNLSSVPYLEVDETYFIKKDNETYFNSNKNKSFWPDLSLWVPTLTIVLEIIC